MLLIIFLSTLVGLSNAAAGPADPIPTFQREPINLAKVAGDSGVLLVGDDHTQLEIKNFLVAQLPTLRVLGFRCLAVEMLPSRFQMAIDQWRDSDQKSIQGHLAQFWGEKGPGIPEALFDLIATAKREGLMVIALDPDDSSLLSREDVNPHWVECVRRCLIGRSGSRMIVFGGSGHFRHQPRSVFSMLMAQGIRCSVAEFSGLDSPESVEREFKTARFLERPVPLALKITEENHRLGLHGSFMVRSDVQSTALDTGRWIINLDPHPTLLIAAK